MAIPTETSRTRVDKRVPCPECRRRGQDRSGNNLVMYTDGGGHCFACQYHVYPSRWQQLVKISESAADLPTFDVDPNLDFPTDYEPLDNAIFAKRAVQWLRQYGISDDEIRRFDIGWSTDRTLLIFPVFGEERNLIMWQGRNFGEGTKYLTKGPKHDIMHLMGKSNSGTLVVTEDAISAIKVGRAYQSMPLWGADMSLSLIKKAASQFDQLGIWLDANKIRDAVKIALRASQYIPTFVVDSRYDPKSYGHEVIIQRVEQARDANILYKDQAESPKKSAIAESLDREAAETRLRSALAVAQNKRTATGGGTIVLFKNIDCKMCGFNGLNNKCHIGVGACSYFGVHASAKLLEEQELYGRKVENDRLAKPEWPFPISEHTYTYSKEAGGS